jgi:4-hydroxy-tetrahydrodipicolinate reductase
MNVALVGYGKMGRAIASLAVERGHAVVATVDAESNERGRGLTVERLGRADVVFEFTAPDVAVSNLLALARLGQRVVSGTTGWLDRLPEVGEMVRAHGGALLYSPNFSPGVQLFLRAATDLARRFAGQQGFEGFVVESHHGAKRDAPSGTGVALRRALQAGDPARDFPVSSVRGGFDPGTHVALFDAPFETVRLEHQARGRQVFAAGAMMAGEWLQGRTGIFTFDQMLFPEGP